MLPLRDAFAVLFFVSVGMAFDPGVIIRQPIQLAGTMAIILIGTPVAAFLLARALGETAATALFLAGGLAQIGEFSFILASLGIGLGLLPEAARGLILGASILTIFLNPPLLSVLERFGPKLGRAGPIDLGPPRP